MPVSAQTHPLRLGNDGEEIGLETCKGKRETVASGTGFRTSRNTREDGRRALTAPLVRLRDRGIERSRGIEGWRTLGFCTTSFFLRINDGSGFDNRWCCAREASLACEAENGWGPMPTSLPHTTFFRFHPSLFSFAFPHSVRPQTLFK